MLPFGVDQKSQPVGIPLIESNMLIGVAARGAGKTASLRCVLLGCALDPTVELHVWELKGSGDPEGTPQPAARRRDSVRHRGAGLAVVGRPAGAPRISAAVIRVFERCGWAHDVRWPTPRRLERLRAR